MEKNAQWSLVGAAWVLVLGVLLLGYLALQRLGHEGPAAPGHLQCPVCHLDVTLSPDTPHVNYRGKDYYFCTRRDERGRDHKTLFLMDPDLYLSGVSSLGPAETAPQVSATPVSASATP